MVLASELDGARTFTELQIYGAQKDDSEWGNMEWSLCHTSLSQLTTTFNDNYDGNSPKRVYYRKKHAFKSDGGQWMGFPFDTAFVYDGRSNLLLETRYNERGDIQNGWATWKTEKRTIEGTYNAEKGNYFFNGPIPVFRLIYGATTIETPAIVKKQTGLTHCFDPCDNSVNIQFTMSHNANVRLKVFDVCGTLIRKLLHEKKDAGISLVKWNSRNSEGVKVSTGIYFLRLDIGNEKLVEKVILVQ